MGDRFDGTRQLVRRALASPMERNESHGYQTRPAPHDGAKTDVRGGVEGAL
jgi:hypothetical protein